MTGSLTLPSYTSSEDDYYNNSRLLVKLSNGNIEYGTITDYSGSNRLLTIDWDDSTLTSSGGTTSGTEYTIYFPIGNIDDFDITNPPEIIIDGVLNENISDKKKSRIIPNIGSSSFMNGVVSGKIIDFIIMEGGYGYSQTPITKIPLICKTSWSNNTSSSGSSGSS